MKYVATYLMLVLGGNESPSAADVTTALEAVGAAQRCLCGAATCRGLVLDALDAAREESDLRAVDARLSAAAHREVPEGWGVRI